MAMWDVHVTVRDGEGKRHNEFCGAYPTDQLAGALESALRRASQERGGVQIVQHPDPPRRF